MVEKERQEPGSVSPLAIFVELVLNASDNSTILLIRGDFFHWYLPKKLKFGKPRLSESTLT